MRTVGIKTPLLVFVLFVVLALLQAGTKAVNERPDTLARLEIGGQTLLLEVADTGLKRVRGLSSRKTLAPDSGMLFFFPDSNRHGIWMKAMRFPIDIIWLDDEWRIVDTRENLAPETFPEVFYPRTTARYVLEVNTGFVKERSLRLGDRAVFTPR